MGSMPKKRSRQAVAAEAKQDLQEEPAVQLFAIRKKVKHSDAAKQHKQLNGAPHSQDHTHSLTVHNTAEPAILDHDGNKKRQNLLEATSKQQESTPDGSAIQASVTFKQLGVSDWLCSVCNSLEMKFPTAVQQGCIPAILDGRDVIGLAETGSGKTAAFALPILQSLAVDPFGVFVLVLTPTRELAFQIAEQFTALSAEMNLQVCVIVGGLDMQQQARQLAGKPHVVVATPGRLKGLLDADSRLSSCFKHARFLVLDEADRVLDPTFASDLSPVLSCLPAERQTLLFSATMTPSLLRLQQTLLQDAYVYKAYQGLKAADKLTHSYVFMPAKVKEVYLYSLLESLQERKVRSAILFASTRERCKVLAALLRELDCPCVALHSGLPQKQRLAALARFKSEQVPLLLATDVASRGLDIPSVDLVINFDVPMLAQDYVHRVGRTARAGRSGWCVTFVTQHDVELVHKIEDLVGEKMTLHSMAEDSVLKLITRVYTAKKAAALQLAEEEGRGLDKSSRRSKQMKKLLKD